jgi:hypothetical protein
MGMGMARKLVAIVAADVVGYSRRMGADEAGTLAALKTHRQADRPEDCRARGPHRQDAGDGLLIEFCQRHCSVQFATKKPSVLRIVVDEVALFPTKRNLDPSSEWRSKAIYDIPSEEPELVRYFASTPPKSRRSDDTPCAPFHELGANGLRDLRASGDDERKIENVRG